MYAHTHKHACTHIHTHIHTRTHAHAHTHTHIHTCTHTHTNTHTHIRTHTHTHRNTNTHTDCKYIGGGGGGGGIELTTLITGAKNCCPFNPWTWKENSNNLAFLYEDSEVKYSYTHEQLNANSYRAAEMVSYCVGLFCTIPNSPFSAGMVLACPTVTTKLRTAMI